MSLVRHLQYGGLSLKVSFSPEQASKTSESDELSGAKQTAVSLEEVDTTGFVVWPGSDALASFLSAEIPHSVQCEEFQTIGQNLCHGKRVIELGCGAAGIPGMLAAKRFECREICFTDNNTDVIDQLQQNLKSNGVTENPTCSVMVKELWWGDENLKQFWHTYNHEDTSGESKCFDVILGADIVYSEEATEYLFQSVKGLLKEHDGIFVLSYIVRWPFVSESLRKCITKYGFEAIEVSYSKCDDAERIVLVLFKQSPGISQSMSRFLRMLSRPPNFALSKLETIRASWLEPWLLPAWKDNALTLDAIPALKIIGDIIRLSSHHVESLKEILRDTKSIGSLDISENESADQLLASLIGGLGSRHITCASLNISGNCITDSFANLVSSEYCVNDNRMKLVKLDLSRNTSLGIEGVLSCLSTLCSSITTSLNLASICLGEEEGLELVKQLPHLVPHLEQLDISSNNIRADEFGQILSFLSENLSSLKCFRVAGNSLENLSNLGNITHPISDKFSQHTINWKLQQLDLSSCCLGDMGVYFICESGGLEQISNFLQVLKLGSNEISRYEVVLSLSSSIAAMKALGEIHLNMNAIAPSDGLQSLVSTMLLNPQEGKHIIDGVETKFNSCKNVVLNLAGNCLGNEGINSLGSILIEAVKGNERSFHIDLSDNGISEAGARVLLTVLNDALQHWKGIKDKEPTHCERVISLRRNGGIPIELRESLVASGSKVGVKIIASLPQNSTGQGF
mmetsp:Transcript_14376/g.18896  ORF Transcript_14376/g.18896 Transcript_14376/m.18896 type:complete len:741 (+) Transcript_14376:385-2607(+)